MPSLYQSLSTEPRQHTFRFIDFTDEEKGLIGSAFYARKLTKDGYEVLFGCGLMGLPNNAVNVEQVGSTDSESFRQRKIPVVTVHSLSQETLSILHSRADQHSAIKQDDYYQT